MRIAVFTECYTPVTNGVVTSVVTLRDTLRAWGHRVYVFAPGTPQPGEEDVFRLPDLPFPRYPFQPARPFPRLPAEFASLDIDVVHCQHPFTVGRLGAETARKHGLPMVYTAHSLYDLMASNSKLRVVRAVGQPYARGVVRRFCARAQAVIVPTQHTRQSLIADGVNARFVTVPTGVPPIYPTPGGRVRIRQCLGMGEDTPMLLYLGRVAPEKRLDLLLRVCVALRERNLPPPLNDFRLAIVGDGQIRADVEQQAEEMGLRQQVVFTGRLPHEEIADWYAASDVFILASPHETQGLALVEAMQAGLPCVAVNRGGPTEVVQNGRTGRLVPFEVEAFADAVEELMRNPELRQTWGQAGQVAGRAYTPEAMARGVLGVYEEVVRRQ